MPVRSLLLVQFAALDWLFLMHIVVQVNFVVVCVLSRVRLSATPGTVARQAPLSMEIFQARILEYIAISYSRGSSQPKD